MQVLSINVAEKRRITAGNKELETGIFKIPHSGPAFISTLGVAGDTIVDTTVHGGTDQAVYLYSQADYQWWSESLGRALEPGTFGENLTLSAFPEQPLKVGDRLTINGGVLLEITAPRVPCLKLATKMGDPTFAKTFVAAVRPGAYARVLSEGQVDAGDPVDWEQTTADYAGVNDIFVEWHKKDWSEALFRKALASPISNIARRIIEQRYTR